MDIFKFELKSHDMAALGKMERANKNYSSLNALSYVNVYWFVVPAVNFINFFCIPQ